MRYAWCVCLYVLLSFLFSSFPPYLVYFLFSFLSSFVLPNFFLLFPFFCLSLSFFLLVFFILSSFFDDRSKVQGNEIHWLVSLHRLLPRNVSTQVSSCFNQVYLEVSECAVLISFHNTSTSSFWCLHWSTDVCTAPSKLSPTMHRDNKLLAGHIKLKQLLAAGCWTCNIDTVAISTQLSGYHKAGTWLKTECSSSLYLPSVAF